MTDLGMVYPENNSDYYVYALYSTNGFPFYIGKGRGRRINDHFRKSSLSHNSHKNNKICLIVQSHGFVRREILSYHADEQSAFRVEEFLISHYGLVIDGGILTNVMRNPRDIPSSIRKLVVRHGPRSKISDEKAVAFYNLYSSKSISLTQAAMELGVSTPYLSQVFSGKRMPHLKLTELETNSTANKANS